MTHTFPANHEDKRRTIGLILRLALGSLMIVGALAFAFYFSERASVVKQYKASEKQRVRAQVETIRWEMRNLATDLILAADIVESELVEEGQGGRRIAQSHLNEELLLFVKSRDIYDRIHLVASDGKEMCRIERRASSPVIVPDKDLHSGVGQPYFIEAINMAPGEIYLSHLDLAMENGQYQKPHIPVLRIATPVFLDKEHTEKAVVIISCRAEKLLKLDQFDGMDLSSRMLLVNSDGYWIRSLDDDDEWGFLIASRGEKTFENRFPGDWPLVSESRTGQFISRSGMFTSETIIPTSIVLGEGRSESVKHTELYTTRDIGNALVWIVISYVSPEALGVIVAEKTGAILIFATGILALLWLGCWYFAVAIVTRKRALKEVKKSEALNRSIVHTATDGIIIINDDSIIQSFNEAATEIFGYRPEEVIGQNVTMLMPEKYARGHDERVKSACKASRPLSRKVIGVVREVQGRRADGSLFPLEMALSAFEAMGRRMFTSIVRDITERKEAEHDLELLALFMQHNPSAVVQIDSSGIILKANPAAVSVFGIEVGAAPTLWQIIPDLDKSTVVSCLETGSSISRFADVRGRSYILMLKGLLEQHVGQLYALDITERKNAELTGIELGRILDDSVNEVYIIDIESFKFVMANKAACVNLGYTYDELLEMSPSALKAPGFGEDQVKAIVEPLLDGTQSVAQFATDHVRKDGTIYPAEFSVQLSTFRAKRVFVTFVVDITEKVNAEKQWALIEAKSKAEESRKREIINSINEHLSKKTGAAFFDELTRQLAIKLEMDFALVGEFVGGDNNTAFAHSLFVKGETSTVMEYDISVTPCAVAEGCEFCSFAEGVQEQFPSLGDLVDFDVQGYIGAKLSCGECKLLGLIIVMSSTPLQDIQFKESVVRMFASRAASELERMRGERQTKQLAQVVLSTSDIVMIADTRSVLTYVNPAFESVTGYSASEVLGKKPKILSSGKQDAEFYRKMKVSLKENAKWSGSLVNKSKAGELFIVEASMSVIVDENGEVTNYISVQRDVTEKRENERRMRQAQKMEAIGALAGGIAHDFNNMLMGITGFTQMVYDELPDDSPLLEDLHDALAASLRARDLVQQILTFSRQRESEHKPVMPHLVLKEALKLLTATLPANIRVQQDIPVNCGSIMGDPTQIHQIMMNLCTNALYAMQPIGGTLSVALGVVQIDDPVEAGVAELFAGAYLTLSVSDTGSGMDAETRLHIFEPFYTTKDEGEGTGMGLSTVYGIVQECGGAIVVDSEIGKGSAFTIYFPRYEGDTETEGSQSETEYRGAERILIVEDDEQALKVIGKMLQKLGYTVRGEQDPVDALETLRKNPGDFDLIITDKTMPNLSGLAFAEKARLVCEGIPILLMTGYAESITPEVAANLGFSALIVKPFEAKTIGREIQAALKKSAPDVPSGVV